MDADGFWEMDANHKYRDFIAVTPSGVTDHADHCDAQTPPSKVAQFEDLREFTFARRLLLSYSMSMLPNLVHTTFGEINSKIENTTNEFHNPDIFQP